MEITKNQQLEAINNNLEACKRSINYHWNFLIKISIPFAIVILGFLYSSYKVLTEFIVRKDSWITFLMDSLFFIAILIFLGYLVIKLERDFVKEIGNIHDFRDAEGLLFQMKDDILLLGKMNSKKYKKCLAKVRNLLYKKLAKKKKK